MKMQKTSRVRSIVFQTFLLMALAIWIGSVSAGPPKRPKPKTADKPVAQQTKPTAAKIAESVKATETPKAKSTAKIAAELTPTSKADLLTMEQQVRKLVTKGLAATVGLELGPARGSGVIISADGYILTAGHVARRPNSEVIVVLSNGRRLKGKTLGIGYGMDSGLVKIMDKGTWPFVSMGKSSTLAIGQWCVAIGHPGGQKRGKPPTVRLGRIIVSNHRLIRTDNTLISGDSGGPLFNLDGKVIGIHSRIGMPTTANIHVPIDTYTENWKRLVAAEAWGSMLGKPGGPFLGVGGEDHDKGARLTRVLEGESGANGGLKAGDIVTHFGGKPTPTYRELVHQIHQSNIGQKVKVKLLREGKSMEVTVKLGERTR
jgi:serine protease Do